MPTQVLLIEDSASLRQLIAFLLEMEGFEVQFGPTDPVLILETIRKHRPAVVILDVHLGGHQASGLDVVRALRQDAELRQVRVLLISGMDYALEAEASGADAFLSKPFLGDELIAKVRSLVQEPPSVT